MKYSLAAMVAISAIFLAFTIRQAEQKKTHRVVFQFTNALDSAQQKSITGQLDNLITVWPDAEIEVVIHGKGVGLVMTNKTSQADAIKTLKSKGIKFVVCENTIRLNKLDKADFMAEVGYVPAGIAEIVMKQEAGWSYVKGGF